MRPKRHYHKISPEQISQIQMYAGVGLPQAEVARRVGLSIANTSRVFSKLGLTSAPADPLPQDMQEKIIKMFRDGDGRPKIAQQLGLPPHRVEQVLVLARLRPQPGEPHCSYFVPDAVRTAIRRDLRAFESETAEKYSVSLAWLRRFLRRRQ